jgi:N-acetyl sugar amidotransferase
MKTIEFCKCCTHPNTRPRITFNEEGICNGCLHDEKKKVLDWEAKEAELKAIIAEALAKSPNRQYDCIIPVSGGKDSHWQTWYAINTLKLKPLCINVQPSLASPSAAKNLSNIAEKLGVDLLCFTPNPQVYNELMAIMFERFGDPFPPFLHAVFSYIAQIALEKNIPVILHGENGDVEYGGSSAPEYTKLDNKGVNARIQSDKRNYKQPAEWTYYGFSKEQIACFQEPADEDLKKAGIQRLFLSDYTPWSNNHHLHVALNVIGGFETDKQRAVGGYTYGYSTDDALYDVYIWMLWPKFGFGRATKYTTKDIHEGKINREKALELVRLYDGEFPWEAFDRFCQITNLSEERFWDAVIKSVGDEENFRREAEETGQEMKIPAWEKIGPDKWRLIKTIHGEERIMELPLVRPKV